jgi:DNA-binding SARP family transcriptional activator
LEISELSSRAANNESKELRIALLGRFSVMVGKCDVTERFRRKRRPASILKALALTPGHALHREALQDLLWPDFDVDTAANNLHGTLHELRRVLEPGLERGGCSAFVALCSNVVTLHSPRALWIDVEAFELASQLTRANSDPSRLEAAVALYAGDLLPEDPYEDWISRRRDLLRDSFADLLQDLARAYLEGGQPWLAVRTLERLVRLEPADEETATQLMHLYGVLGQRLRAMRLFRSLQRALDRDLDCVPETATEQLRDTIASQPRRAFGSTTLTSRELEISELVARGMTNSRIAAALGLSIRTAETHVSRILRKLNVCAREQIADVIRAAPPLCTEGYVSPAELVS